MINAVIFKIISLSVTVYSPRGKIKGYRSMFQVFHFNFLSLSSSVRLLAMAFYSVIAQVVIQHYFSQSFDKNCIALLTRKREGA